MESKRKTTVFMALRVVVITFLGLLSQILVSRTLGPDVFGHYSSLMAFVFVTSRLCDVGLPLSFSFFHRRHPEAFDKILKVFFST